MDVLWDEIEYADWKVGIEQKIMFVSILLGQLRSSFIAS